MGLRIQERGLVVQGTPLVQPQDDLFWFNRPRLLLYLVHFVLFQLVDYRLRSHCFFDANAFQFAFFAWTWMGSMMKPTIFKERVAKSLRNWKQIARKHIKQRRHSGYGSLAVSSVHPIYNHKREANVSKQFLIIVLLLRRPLLFFRSSVRSFRFYLLVFGCRF